MNIKPPDFILTHNLHQRTLIGEKSTFAACSIFMLLALLTRQSQFIFLNAFTLPLCLLLIILFSKVNKSIYIVLPFFVYIGFSATLSTYYGIQIESIIRFYSILLFTILAFYFSPRTNKIIFSSIPIIIQSLIVISASMYLGLIQDANIASQLRQLAISSDWGDIYSFDGIYYRTQIRGNALIPLFNLIFLWKFRDRKIFAFFWLITALALIFSGNVTYMVICGIATLINIKKITQNKMAIYAIAFICILLLIFYSRDIVNFLYISKFYSGSSSSGGVRLDQLNTYLRSISENPLRLLIGKGVGACFPNSSLTDYCDSNYIELQTLNIIHQIGIFGIISYLLILVHMSTLTLNRDGRAIFWLYLILSSTNPYIFDTNQLIATIILVSVFGRYRNSLY